MAASHFTTVPPSPFPQLSDTLGNLTRCYWEDEHSGVCYEDAGVHHLQSELEFCLAHFRKAEVRLG